MKKLLAVSGGPDSMVMLDMFKNDPNVLVAHFNHGMRPSADQDQTFVAQVAHQLQKPFFCHQSFTRRQRLRSYSPL